MAWNPIYKTARKNQIAVNLMNFIKTNQADALLWASPSETLKPFKEFADSVANRNSPNLPLLMFADDDDATDYTQDLVASAYRVNFEAMVANSDPNKATAQARMYRYAVESLIRNIPKAALLADTDVANFNLETIEIGFSQIQANNQQTSFMQKFEIRATFTLRANSEN